MRVAGQRVSRGQGGRPGSCGSALYRVAWRPFEGQGHEGHASEKGGKRPEPHQPVHPPRRRVEPYELAVRALEVREDLLLVVSRRQLLAHLGLHVAGHGGGRVGDGEPLADRAAQQRADLLRPRAELGSGERHTPGHADSGSGYGWRSRALRDESRRQREQAEQRESDPLHRAPSLALATNAAIVRESRGPTCFSTMRPPRSRKNVSGTPNTP